MNFAHAVILSTLAAGLIGPGRSAAQAGDSPALVHTHNEFHFTVKAAYERVFPLFGALEEKKWAPGWEPQFVFPSPAHDQPGMIFTIEHGGTTATWTCTAFDEDTGHVQYAYVVSGMLVTLIDIHVKKAGAGETRVSVVYERTALNATANEHVAQMAKNDASSGNEWGDAINQYLGKAADGQAH